MKVLVRGLASALGRQAVLLAFLTAGWGCSSDGSSDGSSSSAGGNPPLPEITLQALATGLASPVAIANAGDSRLFVTLQGGQIVILDSGQIRPTPFLDIAALVTSGGERGLLSVAFHPKYSVNGFFFVNYTNVNGDTVIARYRVSATDANRADAASAVTLLTIGQPFANHNGGQLQFGRDGYLYIGMGDGGSGGDPQLNGQRADTLLGKLLRIDVDKNILIPPFYSVPLDNPLLGPGGTRNEAWAKGLRNPWRFSFDRLTGDLYIGDVGQNSREEISFQPASSRGGENYGWNVMEGSACFSDAAAPVGAPPCNDASLTLPIIEYEHGSGHCSVTGGYVYRGNQIPELRGTYFYGDFCSGTLWAARLENGAWKTQQLSVIAPDVSTFGEDASGELYLASLSGTLYRVAKAP